MSSPVPSADRQLAASAARATTFTGQDGRAVAALVTAPVAPVVGVAVLVPGYSGSKEDFRPLLDPLAAAGIAAVAVDLPGQYGSAGPADRAGYTPDALAVDLVLVAGALRSDRPDTPVHLLGHSYGGLVARAAVLAAPAAFDSLVLLDSGPSALAGPRRAVVDAMEPVLAQHGVTAVYEATLALARQQPGFEPPPAALAAFLRERFTTTGAAHLAGVGDAIRAEPDRTAELAEELAATGARALVACGEDDDAWPVDVQQEMAEVLDAPFVLIPDAQHSPAVENPAALLEVLVRFWVG